MGNEKGYEVDSKEEIRQIVKGNRIKVFYRIWATTVHEARITITEDCCDVIKQALSQIRGSQQTVELIPKWVVLPFLMPTKEPNITNNVLP